MVSLDHADLLGGSALALPAEPPLTWRMARGLAIALAAVLIPGVAAQYDCAPVR
jgi:hypothetical protein